MPDLDLFQAAEPMTCGTCGACQAELAGPRHYCAISYKTVLETDAACEEPWWYPRAKETH
jgi:hypothetical protein